MIAIQARSKSRKTKTTKRLSKSGKQIKCGKKQVLSTLGKGNQHLMKPIEFQHIEFQPVEFQQVEFKQIEFQR